MSPKMLWQGLAALLLLLLSTISWFYLPDPARIASTDRPLELSVSEDALRLSVVGTSLTTSYTWPEQLSQCSGRKVSVSRIARAGADSDWGLAQVDAIVAERPDLIIIEFSINDADFRHHISVRDSAENHRRLIRQLRDILPDVQILLMTMNPMHGLRRLLRPRLPAYYELYHDLAKELEVGLVDLYPRWLSVPKSSREQQDGLHPSDAVASRMIVPALSAFLGMIC